MTFELKCSNCGVVLGSGSHDQKRGGEGRYVSGETLSLELVGVAVDPPVVEQYHRESLQDRLAEAEAKLAKVQSAGSVAVRTTSGSSPNAPPPVSGS